MSQPTETHEATTDSEYPEWFARIRSRIYKWVEWLARFCELVLLAAVFQFAANKTKDPELGLLAWLLGFAVLFYVAEFNSYITGAWFKPGPRPWWRWAVTLALGAFVVWVVVRSAGNMEAAIKSLAATQH